jgi:hypothetical protein
MPAYVVLRQVVSISIALLGWSLLLASLGFLLLAVPPLCLVVWLAEPEGVANMMILVLGLGLLPLSVTVIHLGESVGRGGRRDGHCPGWGYDLTGLRASTICPECGSG